MHFHILQENFHQKCFHTVEKIWRMSKTLFHFVTLDIHLIEPTSLFHKASLKHPDQQINNQHHHSRNCRLRREPEFDIFIKKNGIVSLYEQGGTYCHLDE